MLHSTVALFFKEKLPLQNWRFFQAQGSFETHGFYRIEYKSFNVVRSLSCLVFINLLLLLVFNFDYILLV